MRSVIASSSWLSKQHYYDRVGPWLRYLRKRGLEDDVILLDNGSSPFDIAEFLHENAEHNVRVVPFTKNYMRGGVAWSSDYVYEWRALAYFRTLFDLYEYDRIIYMSNDFFPISDRFIAFMYEHDGWYAPYSSMHGYPESCCSIITSNCEIFWDFTAPKDWKARNGKTYELQIPWTFVEKELIGDRWPEQPDSIPNCPIDYIAQADSAIAFDLLAR